MSKTGTVPFSVSADATNAESARKMELSPFTVGEALAAVPGIPCEGEAPVFWFGGGMTGKTILFEAIIHIGKTTLTNG